MSKTFNQVRVEIRRSKNDHLHVDVPPHEVPVLRRIHGESHVSVLGKSRKTILLEPSAEAEFARLRRKYRAVNAPDPVLRAYIGGAGELLEFGFTSDPAAVREDGAFVVDHEELRRQAEEAEAARQAAAGDDETTLDETDATDTGAQAAAAAETEQTAPAAPSGGRRRAASSGGAAASAK